MKSMNREFRKISGLPFGVSSTPCPCCKKLERKKHDCTHEFCEPNCSKKKSELTQGPLKDVIPQFHSNIPISIKRKLQPGAKPILFGLVDKSKEEQNKINNSNIMTLSGNNASNQQNNLEKKPFFIIKK